MNDDEAAGRRWLEHHLAADRATLDRLTAFAGALRAENGRQNLVAAASLGELWWRHIVDSAQLLLVSRETRLGPGLWLDLGSGAGFPGLIVGILEPGREVRLVEQRRLRVQWLERMAAELGLSHVRVFGCSLEKLATSPAAVISARAFAPLPKLLRLAARFSTRETLWLLPKGEQARQEVERLAGDLRPMFHVKPSVTSVAGGIVVGRGAIHPERGATPC